MSAGLWFAAWIAVAHAAERSGQVRVRGSGEPIDGAEVRVGDEVLGKTDANGRFTVTTDASALTFFSDRHRAATLEMEGFPERALVVWLEPLPPEYEIVVEAFRPTAQTSRQHLDAEMAQKTPGIFNDAVRLVQSLPGVAVQREYSPTAGDLVVRASAPGDSRYFLDGIELPYLYHYNQYSSVYPTSQIESLDLYASTFGAMYGDAVGGVIEATSKRDAPKAVHGTVHANFLMAGGDVTVPVRGWVFSAAARRSYLDLGGRSSAQYTVWPVFSDYSFRARRGPWSVFAFGAGDGYERATAELDVLDPVEAERTASFDWKRSFHAFGVDRHFEGEAVSGRAVAAWVDDLRQGELSTTGEERLRTGYLSSRLDLASSTPGPIGWGAGWELRAENAQLRVTEAGDDRLLVAEEAPLLARGVVTNSEQWRVRAAVYGEGRFRSGPVRVFPGVRVRTDSLGTTVDVDPRLAIRWRPIKSIEAKLSAGRYSQSVDTDLHLADQDAKLPDTRAWQVAAGIEATVADRLEFVIDGWYKSVDDVLLFPRGEAPIVVPEGDAAGFEFTSRYRLRNRFFATLWAGSAYSRALLDGRRVPTAGDQPFFAGLVTSYSPNERWTLGARVRHGAGLPYTPVNGSLYDANRDAWIPEPGEVNSARMAAYQKFDVGVTRTIVRKRMSLDLTAEIGWVPKRAAALYPTWNYDWTEQGWVIGPTLLPLLSARARF